MLHWVRRFIAVRKRWPVFGEGTFEALDAANPSVFAFVRTLDDHVVLCVNNLSRFAQPVELDLRKYAGTTPVEMLGRVHFPRIGELPYLLDDGAARLLLVHARPGDNVSTSNGSLDELLHTHRLAGCETALGEYIARQRWARCCRPHHTQHRDRRRRSDQCAVAGAAAYAHRGDVHRLAYHTLCAAARHPARGRPDHRARARVHHPLAAGA